MNGIIFRYLSFMLKHNVWTGPNLNQMGGVLSVQLVFGELVSVKDPGMFQHLCSC